MSKRWFNKFTKVVSLLASLQLFWACASIETKTVNLKLANSAVVTVGNDQPRKIAAGETLAVKRDQPILVEASGYASLYLIPAESTAAQIDVTLRSLTKMGDEFLSQKDNANVSDILDQVEKAQRFLATRQIEKALVTADNLKLKYPHIIYIDLLKASCLVVAGKQQQAIAVLEKVLEESPTNQKAGDLYLQLTGKVSSGSIQDTEAGH